MGEQARVTVADQQLGWMSRLPPQLRDCALLARLDRPIGTWLLLLPCWWGTALAGGGLDLFYLVWFAIGAIAMRGAGCTINDIVDRDIDRLVARTRARPVASGRLSLAQALTFLAAQLLIGLIVLTQLPMTAALVALASMPLVIAYPFMKRITYWPQAFLGLTFNWGALVGYVTVTGALDLAALLLYAAGILWTLGYDTIYAHQDKEDDALIGVKSSALRLGETTPYWLVVFYSGMLLCLAGAAWSAGLSPLVYPALGVVALLLARQIATLDIDDPDSCLRIFRSNRLTGLAVFVSLLLGWVAVPFG